MKSGTTDYAIFDMHCDLLCYLAMVDGADPSNTQDIGCAIPFLQQGKVRFQVLAIYTDVVRGSAACGRRQGELFQRLLEDHGETFFAAVSGDDLGVRDKTGIVLAIESASGLAEEDEPLDSAFTRLESLIAITGRVLYISLTHHGENRFGGGNKTSIGLKDDGKALLDYLAGRAIAIDLSHTSDALAWDILNHLAKHSLDIPIIASHSNFRAVCPRERNLPDEIALEIIRRQGLIGVNLLREFIDRQRPEALAENIRHGFEIGAQDALCFGADFFCTKSHPDPTRIPFYHPGHEHAGKYHEILRSMDWLDDRARKALASDNVKRFIQALWAENPAS